MKIDLGEFSDESLNAYRIVAAQRTSERFDALRTFYVDLWRVTKDLPVWRWACDPNCVPWLEFMSPIEALVWGDIRAEGAVLYPQHPVGPFFVDFGHPKARVAIECDGKQWHLDKAKDAERDAYIRSRGWQVFRITGRNCSISPRDGVEFDEDTGEELVRLGPARDLIRQLARDYQLSARFAKETA